jgi:hypothetical protein
MLELEELELETDVGCELRALCLASCMRASHPPLRRRETAPAF